MNAGEPWLGPPGDARGAHRLRPTEPARLWHHQLVDGDVGVAALVTEGDRTVLAWEWQARPKGWLRFSGPVFGLLGTRMERNTWTALKDKQESGWDADST